jgi:hypothetical protein
MRRDQLFEGAYHHPEFQTTPLSAQNLTHGIWWCYRNDPPKVKSHVPIMSDHLVNKPTLSPEIWNIKSTTSKEHIQQCLRLRHCPISLLPGRPHLKDEEDGNLAVVTRSHQRYRHIGVPGDMTICFPLKSAS